MITYEDLRAANVTRHVRFCGPKSPRWDEDEWLTATAGEVGEALNVVKKIVRTEGGFNHGDGDPAALLVALGGELADAVIYLDLLVNNYTSTLVIGTGPIVAQKNDFPLTDWTRPIIRGLARIPIELPHAPGLMGCLAGLAGAARIDLGAAIVRTFNATSDKYGFPERLSA